MPDDLPRVLTPESAAHFGVSRSRTRTETARGRWQNVGSGILITHPRQLTRADWVEVGSAVGGRRSALTGWDALRLRDLTGGVAAPPRVIVLSRERRNRTVGPVLVRRTDRAFGVNHTPHDLPEHPYLAITTTARAVGDAALECRRVDDVRALVARAVQRGRRGVGDLSVELERCPRNGSAFLRTALLEVAEGRARWPRRIPTQYCDEPGWGTSSSTF